MARLEPADKIEGIVGAKRHATDHLGRAVSAESRVYVLHSKQCVKRGFDLRECKYSEALDLGIDLGVWGDHQDVPVKLLIDDLHFDLTPAIPAPPEEGNDQ